MNKKIECIRRLLIKNQAYNEICEWLLSIDLIDQIQVNTHKRDQERAEFILKTLDQAMNSKKFQLVDFEWSILPLELIKITCVTEREEKVFSCGY